MNNSHKTIVVLGASSNEERYSYKAVALLKEHGYNVIPVHPSGIPVCGIETVKDLSLIKNREIDAITLYVNPVQSDELTNKILALSPTRIIMNPGTENKKLEEKAKEKEITIIYGCTLVMLKTGTF